MTFVRCFAKSKGTQGSRDPVLLVGLGLAAGEAHGRRVVAARERGAVSREVHLRHGPRLAVAVAREVLRRVGVEREAPGAAPRERDEFGVLGAADDLAHDRVVGLVERGDRLAERPPGRAVAEVAQQARARQRRRRARRERAVEVPEAPVLERRGQVPAVGLRGQHDVRAPGRRLLDDDAHEGLARDAVRALAALGPERVRARRADDLAVYQEQARVDERAARRRRPVEAHVERLRGEPHRRVRAVPVGGRGRRRRFRFIGVVGSAKKSEPRGDGEGRDQKHRRAPPRRREAAPDLRGGLDDAVWTSGRRTARRPA